MAKGKKITSTAVWILMGLLILGLGGFGAVNLSGQARSIGSVGDKSLSLDVYARLLQQEIRAVEAQAGESLSFQRVQELGLDQRVLGRFVQSRALDNETARMGLSIGDETLRDRILEIPSFQGVDGSFDREAYKFALERTGLSEAQFENQLREEVTRNLLQTAIAGGVTMPEGFVDTLVGYVGERRSFTWTRLAEADLDAPLPEPDEAALRAYYDAHIEDFTLPETKQITYVSLTPDMLVSKVEIPEEDLRAAYEQRSDEFNQPERRLVERLAYLDQAAADQAAADLAAGTSFEDLVEQRGLSLTDIDIGDVGLADLAAAGDAVFAADVGTVVGPLPSPLGPALFRVNGVLPAQSVSFEDAKAGLQEELANDRARRLVDAQAQALEDMMAGGATLEELAEETDMDLGTIDWTADSAEGIAAYEAFRTAAGTLEPDDFPTIRPLDDGGLFAMRLNGVLPARPAPYENVGTAVRNGWTAAETVARLHVQAEALVPQLKEGAEFAALGFDAVREEGLQRSAVVDGIPAGFMDMVFEMTAGDVNVLDGDNDVVLVRLDSIAGPADDDRTRALREQLTQQVDQSLSQNLFTIYAGDILARSNPQINQQAVQAVHANFR